MEEAGYVAEAEIYIQSQTDHWSAKKWTETIMKRDIVEQSRLKLDTRLYEFLKESQVADQQVFEDSRNKILKIIHDVKEKQDERYPEKIPGSEKTFAESVKAGCREASEVAYEYVQLLEVMASQAPGCVALVQGVVKLLLVAQVNYEEMKQNVESYLLKIKAKFQMIDHLTCYVPTARLVDTIARLYDLFFRFLAKALKFYTRSRIKNAFGSFLKPWKKLEPLVTLIEQTFTDIKDAVQFHSHITGEMNLIVSQQVLAVNQGLASQMKRMVDILEELPVKFNKPGDVAQMRDLLRQRVDENLDQYAKDNYQGPWLDEEAVTSEESGFLAPGSPTDNNQLLGGLFAELREYDDVCAQQQRVLEQLPEMRPHRSKERNILKINTVMSWIDSPTSKLLWIDGNHHLQRLEFNASFAVPLIILGESTCETYLILRHFCRDGFLKPNTGQKALIQSLLRQLFKQRPDILKRKASSLAGDKSSDTRRLWALFVECVREANVQCAFIIIDSIDTLETTSAEETNDTNELEGEFILQQLYNLTKDSSLVVKVLLTSALARIPPSQPKDHPVLIAYSLHSHHSQQRKLSLNVMEDEFVLVPQKLVDIQEKRCQTIRFEHLPILYQINSTIYTWDDGELRAFVVAELSGMDPRPFNAYSPLQIRAWSIDHNGKYFTKKYHDLVISQFPGESEIAKLIYIPADYLNDESENRIKLLERGQKYWKLGSGVRHQQIIIAGRQTRIILDQCTRPMDPLPPKQEFEDQLAETLTSELKPLILILCPPRISAYALGNLKWITISIDEIKDISFTKHVFNKLILPPKEKNLLISAIEPYIKDQISENLPLERWTAKTRSWRRHADTGRRQTMRTMPQRSRAKAQPAQTSNSSIILLFGKSGMGKTATAIYAAEHIQRPLLSISSRDLGSTASELATNLKIFLHLAQRWNAVLLLEDADTILEKRSANDAARSSTLLTLTRGLDSYTGLIIVTTIRRPGSLDEAFTSRIQFTIPYQSLSGEDQAKLWKITLKEFSDTYNIDTDDLKNYVGDNKWGDLTGREMKISLKVAMDMAKAENKPLEWSHVISAVFEGVSFRNRMENIQLKPSIPAPWKTPLLRVGMNSYQ